MLLQLPHEALSNYLVVDHVAHSKFDASSSPKERDIKGSADIVKLLFDHGLEFNETFNETSPKERGVTPLQLACEYC